MSTLVDRTKEDTFRKAIKESFSISEVAQKIGYMPNQYPNQRVRAAIRKLATALEIDISHFLPNGSHKKYERVEKTCPICAEVFITLQGHSKEKISCSKGCTNTLLRTGKQNPNWTNGKGSYRVRALKHYENVCAHCGFDSIPEILIVHHRDRNRNNNLIENLKVLCPNCHDTAHFKTKSGRFSWCK